MKKLKKAAVVVGVLFLARRYKLKCEINDFVTYGGILRPPDRRLQKPNMRDILARVQLSFIKLNNRPRAVRVYFEGRRSSN